MKATEETQISVFLRNRPGSVAELGRRLSDAGLSVRGMAIVDTVDIGTVRMIVDDVHRAEQVLKDAGSPFMVARVICLEMPNCLGSFAEIARTMANAGVNIEYAYVTALSGNERSLGVFRVNDIDTALRLEYPD